MKVLNVMATMLFACLVLTMLACASGFAAETYVDLPFFSTVGLPIPGEHEHCNHHGDNGRANNHGDGYHPGDHRQQHDRGEDCRQVEFSVWIPAPWNGTLIVYAHGYSFSEAPPLTPGIVQGFTDLGYGVATHLLTNPGWSVKEGMSELEGLTRYIRKRVACPDRTILWGTSMGSIVALKSIERNPTLYDGAIGACGAVAGSTAAWDFMLGLSVAYDVAFGWPDDWGEVDDVRDDLTIDETVAAVLPIIENAANLPRLEFVRRVTQIPFETFYFPRGSASLNGFVLDMLFAAAARGELEERAKGSAAQNRDHVYTLTEEDLAILESVYGLTEASSLLDEMNAQTTYRADRNARAFIKRYADFKGKLKRPVLTLHNQLDPLAPAWYAHEYREIVEESNRDEMLIQVYVNGFTVDGDGNSICQYCGHCEFSALQIASAVAAMEYWINSGLRPPEELFFPESAGFVAFDPPPPPY